MSCEEFSSSPSSLSLIQHPNHSNPNPNPNPNSSNSSKRKRNLRGTPDPDAEIIALSPRSLTAKNRFICEICNKGFQRDQNLQLHKRGHNLPWKLKQRNKLEVVKKKVYICPEIGCVHHDPVRALGDLTGVKKHYFRKHGEKKWKCEKCSKKYAVQSDWKAHSKICGTREYKCDCGTLFSRKDSFITHRAFCDALTEQNSRMASFSMMSNLNFRQDMMTLDSGSSGGRGMSFPGIYGGEMLETNLDPNISSKPRLPIWLDRNGNDSHFENPNPSISLFMGSSSSNNNNNNDNNNNGVMQFNSLYNNYTTSTTTTTPPPPPAHMSATALLQKAAQMGSTRSTTTDLVDTNPFGIMTSTTSLSSFASPNHENDERFMMMMMKENGVNPLHDSDFTRDFLGVGEHERRSFDLQQSLFKFSSSSMQN